MSFAAFLLHAHSGGLQAGTAYVEWSISCKVEGDTDPASYGRCKGGTFHCVAAVVCQDAGTVSLTPRNRCLTFSNRGGDNDGHVNFTVAVYRKS